MSNGDFNFDRLFREHQKGGAFSAILAYLANRERDPRNNETRVSNLQADLARSGKRFSVEELRAALETLAEAKCGTFKPRRPTKNSQLIWDESLSAREIAGQIVAQRLPQQSVSSGPLENRGDDVEMEAHDFPVRRGVKLPIQLRADMTDAELDNLADFIRVIAASRRTEPTARP